MCLILTLILTKAQIEQEMGNKIVVTSEEATSLLLKPASEMREKKAPKRCAKDQEAHPEQDPYNAKQTSIVEAEANWGDRAFENNADEEEVQELLKEELVASKEGSEAKRDMIKYMKTDDAVKNSDPPIQFNCQGCKGRGTIQGAEGWYCQPCADDRLLDIPDDLTVTEENMDIPPETDTTLDSPTEEEAPSIATRRGRAPSKVLSSKAPTEEPTEALGFKMDEIVHTHSRGGSKNDNTYEADYFIGQIKQFKQK